MQSIRTIDSIISGTRQGAYISLSQSIAGIYHNPERNLIKAYQCIQRSPQYMEKMSQLGTPGNPVYDANLTEEEKEAILLYTFKTTGEYTSFSTAINKALSTRSDVIREFRGFLLHMLSGLRKLQPREEHVPMYHAMPAVQVPLELLGYVQGRTVVWSSFVSVSPNADFFRANASPSAVVFEISGRGAVAYDITPFATATGEPQQLREFLLEADTTFRVEAIEENCRAFNGATLVRLCSEDAECVHPPILYTLIESFREEARKAMSKSGRPPLTINASKMRFEPTKKKLPEISTLFTSMPHTAYTSIRDAVISANFTHGTNKSEIEAGADELLEHCRETLSYLKKNGVLEQYKMTEEQAVAIIIFTFDYGSDKAKNNPCYQVNKVLGTRNTNDFHNMRPYFLHLLSGLRKLPRVVGKPLYRGMNGAAIQPIENHYYKGLVRNWVSFTSTCYDVDFAVDFSTGDFPVVFKITGDYIGYDITQFSIFNEDEVIIEPEMSFQVENVTQGKDGTTYIAVSVLKSEPIIVDIVRRFTENSRTTLNTNTVLPPKPKMQKLDPQQQQPLMTYYMQQQQQHQNQYQMQPQQWQTQSQAQQYQAQPQQTYQDFHGARQEFNKEYLVKMVTPIFQQSAIQQYQSFENFVDAVRDGGIFLANDSNVFVNLTDNFFKLYPQYKDNIYRQFSYADPRALEWEWKNFWNAYLALSEAMRHRLYSGPFIEFCLKPGQFITNEEAAISWTYNVQRKISLRFPSGTLDIPKNTKDCIRAFTKTNIWFFMPVNSRDPKSLVRKIRGLTDIVNSCLFTARLYDPVHVVLPFSREEMYDQRSIFAKYRCLDKGPAACCGALNEYMSLRNVKPLCIIPVPTENQNEFMFRLTLSSSDDIPTLRKLFRNVCVCPILKVFHKDKGEELLNVLTSPHSKIPLSIVPEVEGSFTITFLDDYSCSAFCTNYKQGYTRLNEDKKKPSETASCTVKPMNLMPPTTTVHPSTPGTTPNSYVTSSNTCGTAWASYNTNNGNNLQQSQQQYYGTQQRTRSPPVASFTVNGYTTQPYNNNMQPMYQSPPQNYQTTYQPQPPQQYTQQTYTVQYTPTQQQQQQYNQQTYTVQYPPIQQQQYNQQTYTGQYPPTQQQQQQYTQQTYTGQYTHTQQQQQQYTQQTYTGQYSTQQYNTYAQHGNY